MDPETGEHAVFLIRVSSLRERDCARILADSIRSFGGDMSGCPIKILETRPEETPCSSLEGPGIEIVTIAVPPAVSSYEYGDKVYACKVAEESAGPDVRTLVYLTADSLIVAPPVLFSLDEPFDAAVRPVHIKNVGLGARAAPDGFWRGVYDAAGVEDVPATVVSFVDQEHIRAYFNSAAFAVRPSAGIFRRWYECFEALVADAGFQAGPCRDARHRVFLHQAILSTLIATSLDPKRVRVLPETYGYPYNLHGEVAPERRAAAMDDLVCAIYHDRSIDPRCAVDIGMSGDLRQWIASRLGPGSD